MCQPPKPLLRCRLFGHAWRLPPGLYSFGQDYTMVCKRCPATKLCINFWIERN
jgi:hypothetical protein